MKSLPCVLVVLAHTLLPTSAFVAVRQPTAPPAIRRRPVEALPSSTLFLAATEAVKIEKVGTEIYKPIFTAGFGIIATALVAVGIVAVIIDATDTYENRADDFSASGFAKLEEEFGTEATENAIAGRVVEKKEAAPSSSKSDPEDLYND